MGNSWASMIPQAPSQPSGSGNPGVPSSSRLTALLTDPKHHKHKLAGRTSKRTDPEPPTLSGQVSGGGMILFDHHI